MKRNVKNIILIALIILTCCGIAYTMYYAKNHVVSYIISTEGMSSDMNDISNATEPPEKPGDDASSDMQVQNNMSGNEMQEPPEMPSDISGNEMQEPPEIPSSENLSNMMDINTTSSEISSIYYIIFGIEGLAFSLLIIFLFMSNFNKKAIKETFVDTDKIIIYILSIIILTAIIDYGCVYFTNNYLISNATTTNAPTGNNQSTNITYSSSTEITESATITSGNYNSSNSDENTLTIDGDIEVTLSDITVSKTGDSDGGDNTSFYGTNSAIIAKNGATLTLKNITVTTDATGGNGVFSYGGSATTNNSSSDNTTINISDSKITTTKDNSGGIMTTGGGIMNASNLIINTSGTSSAAIRSDRGGGTVNVTGGTYKTTGTGSPTIYSTANITVLNANLEATTSEGIIIEGKNSVSIDNVNLTDTNNKLNGQSTTYKNIFLYQSMSGDASNGNATFTSNQSNIITNKGDSFYVTNTTATINLTNNKITNNDSEGNFLRIQKDSWGNEGSNGGTVTLNLSNQNVTGNIVVDSISILDISMKSSSYLEGKINTDNTGKIVTLSLDNTSKIKLTADSYITSLNNTASSNSNIDFNGFKLYVNGNPIN